jgi:hypothetical protein
VTLAAETELLLEIACVLGAEAARDALERWIVRMNRRAGENTCGGDIEPLDDGQWPLVSASPIPYFPDRSPVPAT